MSVGTDGDGRGVALGECLGQQTANILGLNLLVEGYHKVAAAREVDALAEATAKDGNEADYSDGAEDAEALLIVRHELVLGILERDAVAQGGLEGEVLPLVVLHLPGVPHASEEHGCEEADEHADDERGGEAADRSCTEVVEDDTGDDGREVRVEDGAEGIAVTCLESLAQALAGPHFFLRALVDEHVGIDGHTQGEHHTGDTTHGERSLERGEDTHGEEQVEEQCAVGHHTSLEAVHGNHVEHQDDEGENGAVDTHADRLGTQCGTDDFLADDVCGSGHLTRLEHVGQVLCLLGSEATRDFRASTGDFTFYVGGAVNIVVEHDGDAAVNVQLGELSPAAGTLDVHLHVYAGTAHLVVRVAGVGDDVALEGGTAVALCHADGIEVVVVGTVSVVDTLHAPLQTQVARQCSLGLGSLEEG